MVQDFDLAKLKDVDLCQLLWEELRSGVYAWQSSDAEWKGLSGCCITPLLMYVDCLDHRLLKNVDMRTPRACYMDPKLISKIFKLDLLVRGNETPESWIYGKLPVSYLPPVMPILFKCFLSLYILYFYFL